ncbi:MAG TPA: CHRD domain-containing protein [Nitrospirota bacterium]|nr:CHRD domain-containing protein [Nitrospirota bacterium]
MKTVKVISLIALTMLLTASLSIAAGHEVFKANLTGKDEVPAAMTKAGGEVTFKLSKDGKEMTYILKLRDIENVKAAHIHAGKMGEEGAVVVGLFGGPKKEGKFNGVLAKGTIIDANLVGPLAGKTIGDLVELLKSGGAYVNVHTDKYPGGEIRGQVK